MSLSRLITLLALAYIAWDTRSRWAVGIIPGVEADQTTDIIDQAISLTDPDTYTDFFNTDLGMSTDDSSTDDSSAPMAAPGDNLSAFRDMIAVSEGTANKGDNGYNVLVGGGLFSDYSTHPNQLITLNSAGLKSTAAGRYQILHGTWVSLCSKLGVSDFSPATQDQWLTSSSGSAAR